LLQCKAQAAERRSAGAVLIDLLNTVYLSLGSNIGDRAANLRGAMDLLAAPDLRILRVSPVYETEPVGCVEQGWFLNLVVETETELLPKRLLARTARIER